MDDYERARFEIATHVDPHAHQTIARDLLQRSDAWDKLAKAHDQARKMALRGYLTVRPS